MVAFGMTRRSAGRPPGKFKGKFPTSLNGVRTKLYHKWCSMVARCTKPSHPAWKYYGGRNITVCDRWLGGNAGFQHFAADMGEPPEGLTLERIDNTRGYEPSNCRWATWAEQARNRDRSGKALDPTSLRQKAIAAGLPYAPVYLRIKRLGWTEDRALSTPIARRGHAK
jgi:hypothetical protein